MFRKQVYTSDVEQSTVDESLRITYSQSKKASSLLKLPRFILTILYSFCKNMASTFDSSWMSCLSNTPGSKHSPHSLSTQSLWPASLQNPMSPTVHASLRRSLRLAPQPLHLVLAHLSPLRQMRPLLYLNSHRRNRDVGEARLPPHLLV